MRAALSGLCGLVAALLLPLALVSVWLHTVVADTDAYVTRVAPLAAEEPVREAVEDLVVQGVREDAGPLLADAGGDAAAAEELLRPLVGSVVGGEASAGLWSAAQRTGHREVLAVLDSPDPLQRGEPVVVPLDPFVDAVREQLVGFGPQLDAIEGSSVALPLASADQLEPARVGYRALEPLWLLLPVAVAVLALLSVVLARRRLRALALLGGLASLLCLVLLASLGAGRGALLATSPSPAAEVLTGRTVDAVSADLRDAAVAGVLVGLAVLVGAAVLGVVVRAVRRTAR